MPPQSDPSRAAQSSSGVLDTLNILISKTIPIILLGLCPLIYDF